MVYQAGIWEMEWRGDRSDTMRSKIYSTFLKYRIVRLKILKYPIR